MRKVQHYVWVDDPTCEFGGGFLYTTDSDEGEQYVSRDDYDELLFEYNNLKNVMDILLEHP